jgi:hypothetical protein
MNKYPIRFKTPSRAVKQIRDIIYSRGEYSNLKEEDQLENIFMIISSSMVQAFEIGLTLGKEEGSNGNSPTIS